MPSRHGEHRSRGQMLPLVAFAVVCLFGMASLAVDLGYWRYQQRVEQAAADGAAIAASTELGYSTSTPASVTAAARVDAAADGFTNNGTTTTVTVNMPPLSGPYTSATNAAEVIVTKIQPAFFGGIFGRKSQSISARAVAARVAAARNCFYALGPSGQGISLNSATVLSPQCGLISNAGYTNNSSKVNASSIGYAAGSTYNDSGTYVNATPHAAIAAVDPCPAIASCAYLLANPPATGTCLPSTYQTNGPVTLSPGTYCNQVLFSNGSTVTLNPGFYYFKAGVTNNNATQINGTGVTIYSGGAIILSGLINL